MFNKLSEVHIVKKYQICDSNSHFSDPENSVLIIMVQQAYVFVGLMKFLMGMPFFDYFSQEACRQSWMLGMCKFYPSGRTDAQT